MSEETDWDAMLDAAELQSVRVLEGCKRNLALMREQAPKEMADLTAVVERILASAQHRGATPVSGALAVLVGPEVVIDGADISAMELRALMQATAAIVAEWQENILAEAG